MALRISAKTCTSEVLAVGSIESVGTGHVFLTLSKESCGTAPALSSTLERHPGQVGSSASPPLRKHD